MLSRDEAVAAAADYLRTDAYPDRADSVVILPETAVEYPYAWSVRFDFKEHIETGDLAQAPFSSVIVVPHDGSAPHFPPTYLPVATYLEQCASGVWPPQRGQ
ncbi:YrhB domain-containing protein [Streptomyces sp. NPDC033538]|uniref:YrhB domain-containing protein n=1 Tax=Streptomyces sp. NPDC033538 TaxID=3155367 RepID=UPI0033C39B87